MALHWRSLPPKWGVRISTEPTRRQFGCRFSSQTFAFERPLSTSSCYHHSAAREHIRMLVFVDPDDCNDPTDFTRRAVGTGAGSHACVILVTWPPCCSVTLCPARTSASYTPKDVAPKDVSRHMGKCVGPETWSHKLSPFPELPAAHRAATIKPGTWIRTAHHLAGIR